MRGQGGGRENERDDDGRALTPDNEAIHRAVHGGGREGVMICSTMGCCDTSVRRHERDYEAASLSRDEFPGANRAARGG